MSFLHFCEKLMAFAPTGTDRFGPAPDRPQFAWTGTSLGLVYAGPYRVSNGLCRSMKNSNTGTKMTFDFEDPGNPAERTF